jgi:protein disulfide-isomerase
VWLVYKTAEKNHIMKTPLTLFFILFLTLSFGQSKLVWHDNLEEALSISKKEKKPIMMFFTGSDWCGWCIRLQKEVFFKEDFKNWAEQNVVLLELDFPRRKALAPEIKAQNMKLQSQFAIRGYPTVWFVTPDKDAQGNLQWVKRGRTGYVAGGPGAWISNANALLAGK